MGSLYDVLARGIQPVKVQNPFAYQQAKQATALQAEQIKEAHLGEQSKQLEIQNAQRNQASAQALMDIMRQNGGNYDKTAQAAAASGKVLPEHLAKWQENTALMKKNYADADKAQLDNLAKKHELAESQVHALLNQPEDQAAAQFTPMMKGMIEQGEVTPQELQSAGIDPGTYPGHDKMELFRQGIAGSKLLLEQEKAKREAVQGNATLAETQARTQGLQADASQKQLAQDSEMLAAAAKQGPEALQKALDEMPHGRAKMFEGITDQQAIRNRALTPEQQTTAGATQAYRAQEAEFRKQQLSISQQRANIAASRDGSGGTGTWSIQEDSEGKPILFNSKTAESKPAPGIQKPGTATKTAAPHDALSYAQDYLKGGSFTGTGDEALMEKFFELAKPSTGFRMTQPQQQMLMQARDAAQGITARIKHAITPSAPYFDDTQRQNIVKTMSDLARSKGIQIGDTAAPSGRVRVKRPDGTTGTVDADKLDAAIKAGYSKVQ